MTAGFARNYRQKGSLTPNSYGLSAPASDIVISVRTGTGIVREDKKTHRVSSGDIVVIEAGTARGIRADEDERLEVLAVTAPPPSDAGHEPVREGIRRGEFDPTGVTTSGDGD